MKRLIPGIRYFSCRDCGAKWEQNSKDHTLKARAPCSFCGEVSDYLFGIAYPDWPVDVTGNLLDDYDYES